MSESEQLCDALQRQVRSVAGVATVTGAATRLGSMTTGRRCEESDDKIER